MIFENNLDKSFKNDEENACHRSCPESRKSLSQLYHSDGILIYPACRFIAEKSKGKEIKKIFF